MRNISLLIAVENYTAEQVPRIPYACADAKSLGAAWAGNGFASRDQTLLLGSLATKTAIESHIRTTLASLTAKDTFYLYYAGHSLAVGGEAHLTCVDTRLGDLAGTSVSVEWLFAQFRTSACERIVLFLDSCAREFLGACEGAAACTEIAAAAWKTFFPATHVAGFLACGAGESSYRAPTLRQGLWAHHLIEAFSAKAPGALEKGHLLTAASLQKHLAASVPRTVRETRTGTAVQTPVAYGQLDEALLADLSPRVEKQKASAGLDDPQLQRVRFFAEDEHSIRQLSGFIKKTHRVPDRVSQSSESFISTLAAAEVKEDLDGVHSALRAAFRFKRKEMECSVAAGGGSIVTPFFDYEVTVTQHPENPGEVCWLRQVVNIREPDTIVADAFESAFGDTFDTLEFTPGDALEIDSIVDQIEDLGDDAITVEYDTSMAWCTITMAGMNSSIHVTRQDFSVVQHQCPSPRLLVESFLQIQTRFVDMQGIEQLPFARP